MPYSVMYMHWYHAILQCAWVQCHSVIYIGIAIVCVTSIDTMPSCDMQYVYTHARSRTVADTDTDTDTDTQAYVAIYISDVVFSYIGRRI